jgi:hypothetical protein
MKKLKEILSEQTVTVNGIGTMPQEMVQQEIQVKLQDLVQRAQAGQYHTIGKTQFDVLAAYWEAMRNLGDQQ